MAISAAERLREILSQHESGIDLGRAALALARLEYPELDEDVYAERLREFAEQLSSKLSPGLPSAEVIAVMSRYLFEELGFCGNAGDYYDPRNSFLNDVIERRTGIPISLSIVYLEVARYAKLPYFGVGLPGHFLVKYDDGKRRVFVDPFNGGRTLKRNQCQKWLRETLGRRVVLRERDFAAVDAPYIIRRMLNNLRDIYLNSRRYRKGLEVLEAIQVLSPGVTEEMKQRAWLHFELGQRKQALAELENYLSLRPQAEDVDDVKKWILSLKRTQARLN
jgi:regulator of sirC expression with transglutaminase-like and TPR domain